MKQIKIKKDHYFVVNFLHDEEEAARMAFELASHNCKNTNTKFWDFIKEHYDLKKTGYVFNEKEMTIEPL